jgi:hypothetical protein
VLNLERIIYLNELATSDEGQAIRKEFLDFIVKMSKSAVGSDKVTGMLLLINEMDSWVSNYEAQLAARKENY